MQGLLPGFWRIKRAKTQSRSMNSQQLQVPSITGFSHCNFIIGRKTRQSCGFSFQSAGSRVPAPACHFQSPGPRVPAPDCHFQSPGSRVPAPDCHFQSPGPRTASSRRTGSKAVGSSISHRSTITGIQTAFCQGGRGLLPAGRGTHLAEGALRSAMSRSYC